MRDSLRRRRAVAAAAALLALAGLSARAQNAPVAEPQAPVPYLKLRPRPKPAVHPAAGASAAPAARAGAPAPTRAVIPPGASAPTLAPPPAPIGRLQPGQQPIPPPELEAFVDGAVRQAMARDHIPGVAVSVVQNGQTVLSKGYGLASFAPDRSVDPDATLFRLGALSASFTWIAVLKEIERGHMRLDAPVNLYLPEKAQVRDQGFPQPMRLQDLMDQAPGFEDRALGRLYERDPARVRPLETYLREERPRRVQPPGLRPEYSNYGVALAGEAVSQVAGQPFEDLIETEIFRPLGMGHTSFREPRPPQAGLPAPMPSSLAAGMAQGYHWTGAALEPRAFAYAGQIAPAASAASTASDMARYMALLLNGGTLGGASVYGPATAQALRTTLLAGAPNVDDWTHGLEHRRLAGGLDGFGLSGQTLSFRANMLLIPALGLGVFVAANSDSAGDLTERLPGLLAERFYAGPPPSTPAAGDPDALRRTYAGQYLTERRRYGGLEKFVDLLRQRTTVGVDPRGLLIIRGPEGDGAWVADGPPGQFHALLGDRASAFEIKDGRAVRWFAPSGVQSFARVGWLMQPGGLRTVFALALLASLATLAGLILRDRRDFRQTAGQRRASALQTSASALWLTAMLAFGAWASGGAWSDEARAVYGWPGGFILIASACALVAAVASVGQFIMLPTVWRGGRRLDSWSAGRKFSFTVTTLVFLAFSAVLAMWGALEPWNN